MGGGRNSPELFNTRLKAAISASGKTYQEISRLSGVDKRSIDGYMGKKNPSRPLVDAAVSLAVVLGTTVEELVLGDEGRKHVIEWATRNVPHLRSPPGLETLCDDLKKLDAASIEIVRAAVKKIIELKESETPSEPKPQAKVS